MYKCKWMELLFCFASISMLLLYQLYRQWQVWHTTTKTRKLSLIVCCSCLGYRVFLRIPIPHCSVNSSIFTTQRVCRCDVSRFCSLFIFLRNYQTCYAMQSLTYTCKKSKTKRSQGQWLGLGFHAGGPSLL